MKIYVEDICPNLENKNFNYMWATVVFSEETNDDIQQYCEVKVFIEKDDRITISDFKNKAIEKAKVFLSKV